MDLPVLTSADSEPAQRRVAGSLADRGVGEGDRVVLAVPGSAEYVSVVLGALRSGIVAVPLDPRLTDHERDAVLSDVEPTLVVDSPGLLADLLDGPEREVAPWPRSRPMHFTSGTTGRPKGVMWRHGDLIHSIAVATYGPLDLKLPENLDEAVAAARDAVARGLAPVTMPVVPLMHGTGLFNTIGSLLVSGTIVFAPPGRLDPRRVWETIAAHGVTTMIVAGNAVSRPLVDELNRADAAGTPHDLSSVRTVLSSGTAMSDAVKAELHRRGRMTIVDALASSEGGPFAFAITSTVDDLPGRFFPVPATSVFDPDDNEVTAERPGIGVLAYRGPLPVGYHNDDAKTAATFRYIDGIRWSQPGDLVEVQPDGSVRFLGRGSGVINTGGEKVHPQEVEDALLSHPAVKDAVVVGRPHDTWGEVVSAIVAVDPAAGVVEAELIEHLRPQLAGYKVPRVLLLVPEIPRTPTGKIEMAWARSAVSHAR